jgi:hypothetical protein
LRAASGGADEWLCILVLFLFLDRCLRLPGGVVVVFVITEEARACLHVLVQWPKDMTRIRGVEGERQVPMQIGRHDLVPKHELVASLLPFARHRRHQHPSRAEAEDLAAINIDVGVHTRMPLTAAQAGTLMVAKKGEAMADGVDVKAICGRR